MTAASRPEVLATTAASHLEILATTAASHPEIPNSQTINKESSNA
jgi:hypothetical protein